MRTVVRKLALGAAVGVLVLTASATAVAEPAGTAGAVPRAAAQAPPTVSVQDGTWLKNGQEWLPRGFNMVGLAPPQKCLDSEDELQDLEWVRLAHTTFAQHGEAELKAARDDWKADTVRFQVSESGLDPQHEYYDGGRYLKSVENGVKLARDLGFVVILSVQDQGPGCGDADELPTAETERALRTLVPEFKQDRGVMFELFNEPDTDPGTGGSQPRPAEWERWRDGDAEHLGQQQLVEVVRELGARNVLLADGARKGASFEGMWNHRLKDKLNQTAYAAHPYWFHREGSPVEEDRKWWEDRFGYLTDRGAAVIATEWNAHGEINKEGGRAAMEAFLDYLPERNIGITAHAFDAKGTMVKTLHPDWKPTTLNDGPGNCAEPPLVHCGPEAGEKVKELYKDLSTH
jgi:hypothetical protein